MCAFFSHSYMHIGQHAYKHMYRKLKTPLANALLEKKKKIV